MAKIFAAVFVLAILGGLLGSWLFTLAITGAQSQDKLIREFYEIENAVYISPHSLRNKMDKGHNDFVLVDLRSTEEYEREHIISAVSIPAYKDKNTPAYEEKERIISEFNKLSKDKDIIVYCYSIPCMTGRKIGKLLAENGIYVKHLGIGWNEWRYFWTLWNHEHEWNTTRAEDYAWRGKDAGTPKIRLNSTACAISGDYSC